MGYNTKFSGVFALGASGESVMTAGAGRLKGDDWRGEFEKLRKAQFGKRRTRRK